MRSFFFSFVVIIILAGSSFAQFVPYNKIYTRGSEYCFDKRVNSTNLPILEGTEADIKHTFDALDYSLELDLYNNFISS